MNLPAETKTCLIISYGPVPTPEYQTVEGGGMRAWGLAQGLRDNGIDVTVAVNEGFAQTISAHEGIYLKNWSLNEQFEALINEYDCVIVSYCMGDVSEFVAKNIGLDTQLVLDVYVPIYVEVSARDSADIEQEYLGYMREIQRYNKVLKRGDYFLCANDAQKTFYIGVLSSLGVINPRSYREDRILIVPFGIEETAPEASHNPYKEIGIKESDFVVLWFGGLYPWFRIEELLESMKALKSHAKIKFVIVGSKNPFNTNKDFIRQHEKALKFCKQEGLFGKTVHFVEWVDFDQRINWYKHADIVISLNQPGEENTFSWRTRVMDYLWGDMVIVTNGGDPLSNELIEYKAAVPLAQLTAAELEKVVLELSKDPGRITKARQNLLKLKPKYFWPTVTEKVASIIQQSEAHKPYKDEAEFAKKIGAAQQGGLSGKLATSKKILSKASQYSRQHGLKNTLKYSAMLAINSRRIIKKDSEPRYIFISHPIDNTGAPLVLMQIVEEFAKMMGSNRIQLVAPNVNSNNRQRLKKLGVRPEKAAGAFSDKILRLQLAVNKDDYVLMNTIAIHDNYRQYIFRLLENNDLHVAHWFIHEDEAQFRVIAPHLLEKSSVKRIRSLVKSGKLKIHVPSQQTAESLNQLFGITEVRVVPLRLDIDAKYGRARKASDYSRLNFLLSGNPSDGRKGQLIALAAFERFMLESYVKNPKEYRDFRLNLLSIGQDYISQQIRWIGEQVLGKRLVLRPSVPYEEALEIAAKSNAVICCSLNETFALYVAEGMYMGHIVLRNNSAGVDEQLRDGVNGLAIDHTNIQQFADALEKLLNKRKTSDEALQKMGRASQDLIAPYLKNTYIDKLL